MAALQYLQTIYDAQQGTLLYTAARVTEWDTSFSCPSSVVVMPGVGGGMNTRGGLPNPMAPRVASLKFQRKYAGNANYETERDTLVGALRNKELRLVTAQPDGSQRQNYGMLTDFVDRRTIGSAVIAEFDVKFSIGPKWKSLVPANTPQYDKGLQYDVGVAHDTGLVLALAADVNTITLTNNGNAWETEGIYSFIGPFDGPISVTNFNDPRGSGYGSFVYSPAVNLAAGEIVVIDTGIGSVTRAGIPDADPAHFQWGGPGVPQREWFTLRPGANAVQVFHGGGATGGKFVPVFYDVWE